MLDRPIIGIDLDDVLWDLLSAWLKRHNEVTDDSMKPEDIKSWDITQYINKGSPEMLFYILEQSDFWETVQPNDGGQKILNQLIDDGYNVYIVTASSYKTLESKMARFYELFPFVKESQVIITEHKQMIDLDLLIDDKPDNLCEGLFDKLLFDTPHNRWCNEKGIGAKRVYDWEEIYDYIKEKFPIERSYIGR